MKTTPTHLSRAEIKAIGALITLHYEAFVDELVRAGVPEDAAEDEADALTHQLRLKVAMIDHEAKRAA